MTYNCTFSPLFHIVFIVCSVSLYVVLVRDNGLSKSWVKVPTKLNASSLWCYSNNNSGKTCKFSNLYYVPSNKHFLFILSSDSVLYGVEKHLDLMQIEMSSVLLHNKFIMNLAIVSEKNEHFHKTLVIENKVFLLWRFKWDNIMHVIHDDLLPLHETYNHVCAGVVEDCVSSYNLAFVDEGEHGPLSEWYNIFSAKKPMLLHQAGNDTIMCFQEALAGLDRSSIWFQYGFGIPQGPIMQTKSSINQIRRFTNYVLRKFSVASLNLIEKNVSVAVLFSRKINRKILNENEVFMAVNDVYKNVYGKDNELQLFNTDLSLNNTQSILSVLIQADLVIGMHGSAMILSMFAKPGTAVVEMFPYGIKPEFVSPLRAMCQLPGIGLLYESWSNVARDKTVVHPNATPLLGGIHHLTMKEQEKIESITEVPAVFCCHNPLYLYRMYQDTWVDVNKFANILNALLLKKKNFSLQSFQENFWNKTFSHWYFPAPVSNIHCSVKERMLKIFWMEPVNTKNGIYDITVVIKNGPEIAARTSSAEFIMELPNVHQGEINVLVWVKCIWNHKESLDTYAECVVNL